MFKSWICKILFLNIFFLQISFGAGNYLEASIDDSIQGNSITTLIQESLVRAKNTKRKPRPKIKQKPKKNPYLAALQGPPGPQGPQGNPGPPGLPGLPGKLSIEKTDASLTFCFNSNAQSYARGTFIGVVTLPDQSVKSVEGVIGGDNIPCTIVVGPISFVGSYSAGYFITSLEGQLDVSPTLTISNSLTGDHVEFVLNPESYSGGCDVKHFINRYPSKEVPFDINRKVIYPLINERIDVIIPSVGKDLAALNSCIEGLRENCTNLGRVIVVSPSRLTDEAEWFDEALYPFTKYDVSFYLNGMDPQRANDYLNAPGYNRVGWFYQQLLKLYAPLVIPEISSNVLMVDSDTIFYRPVEFLNSKQGGLYDCGGEYHLPYFQHMNDLLPGLRRVFPHMSGICHHMLFQKAILDDLFFQVEKLHQKEFWKVFCLCVDPAHLLGSGASEYEIYFNFAFSRTDQVQIRPLKWMNSNYRNLDEKQEHKNQGYDHVSYHTW